MRRARLGVAAVVAVVALGVVAVATVARHRDDDRANRSTPESPRAAPKSSLDEPTHVRTTESGGPVPFGRSTEVTASSEPDGCRSPEAAVSRWPMRRRLAALVTVGVDPAGPAGAMRAVGDHHVGGVFVGGNASGLLTSGALQSLRRSSPTGLLVAVDEEGGRVQRIEQLDGDVPPARDMASSMTPEEVGALARRRARVMAAHGITVDLAPVVDVSDQPDMTVIGDRSWSDDPRIVAAYARAYAEGLLAEGISPVLKHFPGHGSASGDTHEEAASTAPLDGLVRSDLVPYRQLLPMLGTRTGVMLGHLDVPGLTEEGIPASLSPATVRLLRTTYGFSGVIMTDDLSGMAAVTARLGVAEAAVRALAAGVDMVLFANVDVGVLLDHLELAVSAGDLDPTVIDASVARTLRFKGIDPCAVRL